ncbi:transglycosylase SLT domain-containing protein [Ramlibacter sp. PS4R-6]|uniref:transglycosylase SLT domain-containing protein n=1 Tax=Ramlibacter sp. PS4R-6 TaxID=3133438 RepID=UPI0030A24A79
MRVARSPAFAAFAGFFGVMLACTTFVAQQQMPRLPELLTVELPRVEIAVKVDREASYFDDLRAQVRWVPTKVGRATMMAPDFESRLLLAKSAAERAGLGQLGLSYKDVYAIINAETSWAPRTGASRDGTPNLGIAQFEPATAKALGIRDPDDPVEAVHAAAVHIKEAALWSEDRLRTLKLGKAERAEKLREGISIYYNLSTRGRNQWNGLNTAQLPVETQRHIANARYGVQEVSQLESQLRS